MKKRTLKIFSIALTLMLLLSLSACGSEKADDKEPKEEEKTESVEKEKDEKKDEDSSAPGKVAAVREIYLDDIKLSIQVPEPLVNSDDESTNAFHIFGPNNEFEIGGAICEYSESGSFEKQKEGNQDKGKVRQNYTEVEYFGFPAYYNIQKYGGYKGNVVIDFEDGVHHLSCSINILGEDGKADPEATAEMVKEVLDREDVQFVFENMTKE